MATLEGLVAKQRGRVWVGKVMGWVAKLEEWVA
jgi:hypothetical protein